MQVDRGGAEEEGAGNCDRENPCTATDAGGKAAKEEHHVARIPNRGPETDDRQGSENPQPAGEVVSDDHDHDGRRERTEDHGVEKGAGVGQAMMGPSVNRGNHRAEQKGRAQCEQHFGKIHQAGGAKQGL